MKRVKLSEELEHLAAAIKDNKNLAVARFSERDLKVATAKLREGEDPRVIQIQEMVKEAISEDRDMYFKGFPCYSCAKEQVVDGLLSNFRNKDNTTLSCLFTNISVRYMPSFIEVLKGRNVIMIAPWNALCVQNPQFPVNIRYVFRYKQEPFSQVNLLGEIKDFIEKHDLKNYIFLMPEFQTPIGEVNETNVLVNELHKFNQNNSYINVGNVFDTIFYGQMTKTYHNLKHFDSYKNCVIDLQEDK